MHIKYCQNTAVLGLFILYKKYYANIIELNDKILFTHL